jgi:hypothetical protein
MEIAQPMSFDHESQFDAPKTYYQTFLVKFLKDTSMLLPKLFLGFIKLKKLMYLSILYFLLIWPLSKASRKPSLNFSTGPPNPNHLTYPNQTLQMLNSSMTLQNLKITLLPKQKTQYPIKFQIWTSKIKEKPYPPSTQ